MTQSLNGPNHLFGALDLFVMRYALGALLSELLMYSYF